MQGKRSEHRYGGVKIEVHTEPVGQRWDWWFILDDRPPRHSADGYAPSEQAAVDAALEAARRIIDGAA